MDRHFLNRGRAATGALIVLCCIADAFVLRTTWTGRQIAEGQFRHGYFERFSDGVGLALDNTIRPLFPQFLLTDANQLGVPPGAVAVATLNPGTTYDLARDAPLAPYVVLGVEAPLTPLARERQLLPGEARLSGARTLEQQDGRLALVAWDPNRPWREDAARLVALRAACAADGPAALEVSATGGQLAIRLGRCALAEPLPASPPAASLFATLAGPDWTTVARRPGWIGERWFVWQVPAAVIARVFAMWWAVGLIATAAVSIVLFGATFPLPVAATLTWPVALIIGIVAATLRAVVLVLRRLPPWARTPVLLSMLALAGYAVTTQARQPRSFPPIMRTHHPDGHPDTCALVGYSTVQGASLRRGDGGIRWFLDEDCARCRQRTAALAAGGETLAWARDAYCNSAAAFAAGGLVIFLGGADDDFLWGVFSMARMFVVNQQGIDQWRQTQGPSAAASLARIDAQIAALDGLIQCAHARGARFLFLHDFLMTDLVAGREPDRARMLARRQAVVEAAGGTFIDLLAVFGAEAGISWFNDYVHPSAIGHERIAELACRQSS